MITRIWSRPCRYVRERNGKGKKEKEPRWRRDRAGASRNWRVAFPQCQLFYCSLPISAFLSFFSLLSFFLSFSFFFCFFFSFSRRTRRAARQRQDSRPRTSGSRIWWPSARKHYKKPSMPVPRRATSWLDLRSWPLACNRRSRRYSSNATGSWKSATACATRPASQTTCAKICRSSTSSAAH